MRRKNPKFDNQEENRSSDGDNRNSADRRGSRNNDRRQNRSGGSSRSERGGNSRGGSSSSRGGSRGSDNKKSYGNKRGGFDRKQDSRQSDNRGYSRDSNNDTRDQDRTEKRPYKKSGDADRRSFDKKSSYGKKPQGSGRRSFVKRDGDSSRREDNTRGGNRSYGRSRNDDRNDNRGGNRRSSFENKHDGDNRREGSRKDSPKKYGQDKREIDRAKIGRKFRPRKKVNEPVKADDGLIRLNKYIANSGICSRRQADEYIRTGLVEVNGKVITEMGFKVKPEDDVRFDGARIAPEKKTYVLLNKPKGYITTTNDEHDRKTVMDLVANATSTRLFPVGRLDRQTTGVLLFTNDGYLSKKLTHPSHNITKIYHVILDRDLHGDDMEKIRQGIHMHEGLAKVDKVSFIDGKAHNEVGVEIHIGWNRVVRRIFEKLGYKVEALDRVQFAGLTKKNVKRGQWRILDQKEVNFLKML